MHVLICGGGVIGVSIAPARWRGTGSPPTTAWSARSARSPGLQLRPLYRWHQLCGRDRTYTRVQKSPEIRIIGNARGERSEALVNLLQCFAVLDRDMPKRVCTGADGADIIRIQDRAPFSGIVVLHPLQQSLADRSNCARRFPSIQTRVRGRFLKVWA